LGVKVKSNLKDLKKFIPEVKKTFRKQKSERIIETAVRDDILRGVSPVKGQKRFKKYSKSYKDQIRGLIDFRTIGTGASRIVFPLFPPGKKKKKKGTTKKTRKPKSTSKTKKTQKTGKKKAKTIKPALQTTPVKFGKKLAPVNMKLSGKMLEQFTVRTKGTILAPGQFKLLFKFNNVLADIHNRLGAAGKTIRRLLPTESGEQFNNKISRTIRKELQKAVSKVVNKGNRR